MSDRKGKGKRVRTNEGGPEKKEWRDGPEVAMQAPLQPPQEGRQVQSL